MSVNEWRGYALALFSNKWTPPPKKQKTKNKKQKQTNKQTNGVINLNSYCTSSFIWIVLKQILTFNIRMRIF